MSCTNWFEKSECAHQRSFLYASKRTEHALKHLEHCLHHYGYSENVREETASKQKNKEFKGEMATKTEMDEIGV